MRCRPGLRVQLGLAALTLAILAVLAAGLSVAGLMDTKRRADDALAAQRRIEVYGALSARMTAWVLASLSPDRDLVAAQARVVDTIDMLERLIATESSSGRLPEADAQSLGLARIRVQIAALGAALARGSADPVAALAAYAGDVPTLVAAGIDSETRRRDAALAATDRLAARLQRVGLAITFAAPLVLVMLYLVVLKPFVTRLAVSSAHVERLATTAFPEAEYHDELGLFLAHLRRSALRLARRQARLEATIATRTAEVQAANVMLSRVDDERRRFFADVSHELRTPLTVILGEAELNGDHPDPATRESFATIRSRAERLFRRIEDLLRIARSESGRLELEYELVDLGAVVGAARTDVAPLLARAGVVLRVEVPSLMVEGDADWLRQVFAGLLENAGKYAGSGATVVVRGQSRGAWARVTVSDDGPGVPEDRLGALFDRFERNGTIPAKGFGVGLALARWVIEVHGGSLIAERSPTGGLELEVCLPRTLVET